MLSIDPAKRQRTIMLLSALLFFGLLLWGGYSFMVYLGAPVHVSVLLTGEAKNGVDHVCGETAFFCRGWHAVVPFLSHTIERARPFLWYGVVSLVLYIIFLGWRWLQTGATGFRVTVSPMKIFLCFLLSVCLLFTTLIFENNGNHKFRWIFEPVPQVFVNATEDGLKQLQINYQRLQDEGCLSPLGHTDNGAGVYSIAVSCMELGLLTHVLPQVLVVLVLLLELMILGRALFVLFKVPVKQLLVETMVSMGLGIFGWIAILWSLAVLSQVTPFSLYTSVTGWLLVALVPIFCFRHVLYWYQRLRSAQWEFRGTWSNMTLLLTWFLISYLALNFLSVIRPFPIGWDDLGSYLNRPRLLVSYGYFIHSMATFQWEYLTSLGFLLFGLDKVFGATTAMMINWTAGLIAVFSVFTFGRVFLGRERGILSALLYYTLPLVGHFSFADMKIDNAVFSMGVLSVLVMFLYLFPPDEDHEWTHWQWIALAGLFGGAAFAFKPTAIMVMMSLGAILLAMLHWSAFFGAVLLALVTFAFQGQLRVDRVFERMFGSGTHIPTSVFLIPCLLIGITCLAYAVYRHRQRAQFVWKSAAIFSASFVVAVLPWIIHNNIQHGNIIPRFEMGAPNTLSPTPAIRYPETVPNYGQKKLTLPPELALDPDHPACQETGHKEELDRYWGFRQGIGHYLTLPWRTVMNFDSAGYYVTTTPALLLFPLLLLVPFFWERRARWMRWLFCGTLFILLQWMFLANGIPWYGIGVFLGLSIGLEFLVAYAPDVFSRVLGGVLLTIAFFTVFAQRFWQFEQQRNILEYPFRKVSAEAMEERTIPYYDDVARYVMQRHALKPDRPYLYRVGTFIPYFIPRNLEIIGITDHQLDVFNCLYQERNPMLTLKRLKALGFNSIIFDTNTATIERNPQGTLHKKVLAFVDFLNTPELGLQVVVNDPERGVAYVLIPD